VNRSQIQHHRQILEATKTELLSSGPSRSREDIAVQNTADAIDAVQFAGDRDLAISNLNRETKLLRSIRGALVRINDGSYGVCLKCDNAINPKRLDAVPWAEYCLDCQEQAERHGPDINADNAALELAVA
jgi:DnaK suppressor protein